ncbi:MAG TPA: RHS repeat-associated core domain-containing protein [Allosphingosinicella sp.]|jgi:RHS repeat-associated protein
MDGLNQAAAVNGSATSHDARGNVTTDGLGTSFAYTSDNLMTSAAGAPLHYDPLGRLALVMGASWTLFAYDGGNIVAENETGDNLQFRYVYLGGELLMRYDGPGVANRADYHADERGSIVAGSSSQAAVTAVNRYDEYGMPPSGKSGRFQYTSQAWIPEAGLYYHRGRMYNPRLGRFMQPNPIGYGDGMNLYAYATGRAAGIPLNTLRRAAGFVQQPSAAGPGHWSDVFSGGYGDQPSDIPQIIYGYRHCGGSTP